MSNKLNSKEITRRCEKCNQSSLLLTQEIKGKTSINVVIKFDEGVVAERWSCQNCDSFFQLSLESPNPLSVWFVLTLIPLIVGLMGIVVSILQMIAILPKPSNFLFTLIYCTILFVVGLLGSKYAYFKKNILKRNPIVEGLIPIPMIERKENLPYDRRPRLCTCGLKMNCVSDITHSFNMIPMGVNYVFKCESASSELIKTCNKEIQIESFWRSIILSFIVFILILILKFSYDEKMIESIGGWICFGLGILIVLYLIIYRTLKIYNYLKHPKVQIIY